VKGMRHIIFNVPTFTSSIDISIPIDATEFELITALNLIKEKINEIKNPNTPTDMCCNACAWYKVSDDGGVSFSHCANVDCNCHL